MVIILRTNTRGSERNRNNPEAYNLLEKYRNCRAADEYTD